MLALSGLPQQIIDQCFGVDLFLDVERRSMDDEVGPILLILATPDKLRIKIAVTACLFLFEPCCATLIGNTNRVLLCLLQDGLVFSRGDVLALGFLVGQRFDGLGGGLFFGHECVP